MRPEDGDTFITTTYKGQKFMQRRSKKGSVSWLLAAAIRMCKKYPAHCLRQDGGMDVANMADYP